MGLRLWPDDPRGSGGRFFWDLSSDLGTLLAFTGTSLLPFWRGFGTGAE
jgi:hypothetical protein